MKRAAGNLVTNGIANGMRFIQYSYRRKEEKNGND
jgi:hypothetical protein